MTHFNDDIKLICLEQSTQKILCLQNFQSEIRKIVKYQNAYVLFYLNTSYLKP